MTESSRTYTILHDYNASVAETSPPGPIIVDGQPNHNHRIRKFLGISILAPILLLALTPWVREVIKEYYHYSESSAYTVLYTCSGVDLLVTIGCLIAVFNAKGSIAFGIIVIQSIFGIVTGLISLIIATIVTVLGGSFIHQGMAGIGCTEFCGLRVLVGGIFVASIAFVFLPLFVISSWARYVAIRTNREFPRSD